MSDEQDTAALPDATPQNRTPEEKGRFLPGRSGNPGGRPKKLRELEERILTEFGGDVIPLLQHLLVMATTPTEDSMGDVHAAKEFLDRVLGKARQRAEVTGKDGAPLGDPVGIAAVLSSMTSAELRARLAELQATRANKLKASDGK